jgi:hypothetical protein
MSKELAKELGRAGGKKTFKKHGREHFQKMAQKRWENYCLQHGHDWDIVDFSDSEGGEAYEYCTRCGKKKS